MKAICLLVFGMLFASLLVFAGSVITNDTGEDATSLRIRFSEPVLITGFGDVLTSVAPLILSSEFVFSGGTVNPWDSLWLNFAPATATIMSTEWLKASLSAEPSDGGLTGKTVAMPVDQSALPTILEYGDDTFANLAADSATTASRAAVWGLPGCLVSAVRTTLTSDSLLIDIQLREGDEVGEYVYILGYVLDTETDYRLSIQLEPADGLIELGVKKDGGWGGYVALTSGLDVYTDSVRAVIPVDTFVESVRMIDLASSCVNLKLVLPTTPDFVFAYPGCGTMPTAVASQFLADPNEEVDHVSSLADFQELLDANLPEAIIPSEGFGPPALRVEGSRIVDASGEAVVLRGISPAHIELRAGEEAYFLKRDLVMAKAWGANTVLIPIAPLNYLNTGSTEYIERFVDNYVMWAGELGMYAIVHWKANGNPWMRGVGGYEQFVTTLVDSLKPLRELAARYSQCPWVLYQPWGETITYNWDTFSDAMEILVDDIREQSPDAVIIVDGVYIATLLDPIIERPIHRGNIVYGSDVYPWVWGALSSASHSTVVSNIWDGVSWQEQARNLIDAGYPLILPEWGFGDPTEPSHDHVGTPDSFGIPLMEFCEGLGIGWIAYCWDRQWDVPMFVNEERTELFPFGEVVRTTLQGSRSDPIHPYSGSGPIYEIAPVEAVNAGCDVVDVVEGDYGGIASAILRAAEVEGWLFSHWEGAVDHPESPVVSVDLPSGAPAVAVFRENLAASFDLSIAPFAYRVPQGYVPEEFWLGESYPIEESQHWGLPGHEVSTIFIDISDEELSIGWELVEPLLSESVYNYELFFYSPNSDTTLFVSANPTDNAVHVNMSKDGEYFAIQNPVFYYDESSQVLKAVIAKSSDSDLPDFIALERWTMEAYLVCTGEEPEFYNLFRGITYAENTMSAIAETTLGEGIESIPKARYLLLDDFADHNVVSEIGTSWQFGEWGDGKLLSPPQVASMKGESYLQIEANGLPSVGATLALNSIDLAAYEVLSISLDATEGTQLVVELFHEDTSWPDGGQYVAYTDIEVLPGLQEYVLPLSGFLMAQEELAGCDHCTTEFAFEDVDLLVIYIDGGTGVLKIHEVSFKE